jgi:hypothetical protein
MCIFETKWGHFNNEMRLIFKVRKVKRLMRVEVHQDGFKPAECLVKLQ